MGNNKWLNLVLGIGWLVVALLQIIESKPKISIVPIGIACLFFLARSVKLHLGELEEDKLRKKININKK